MKKTLSEIFRELKLDFSKTIICPMIGGQIGKQFQITPSDFIQFAKSDLKDNTNRGLINSLTNCKRAIDCEVDTILETFGINLEKYNNKSFADDIISKFTKSNRDLPYKLKLIESLGFTNGKLLSEIRTIRNKLEHYYQLPKVDEVEDSIEIAKMFIDLVQAKFYIFEYNFYISDKLNQKGELNFNKYCSINFDTKNFEFQVYSSDDYKKSKTSKDIEYIYKYPDKEYLALIRLTNTLQDKIDAKESLKYLLEIIEHPIPAKNVDLLID